ncbi:cobalamin biosynthetic protein CobN [Prochlorococcus marinus str. MIT 9515]|uniref:Cobalamin biosynthetic protein CobN n=1 Tax=Prochlorococcus marinus (strain MIT 9515) TaxID=167542 RepID=A2BWK7_PROM5|nr:cobaltochelatase subunit CobN [Prochlorococcus marinus]ABM72168.1 cobalamin biosynthetic protein CobN [Prochlorococcus marinus str. MIT 9515]
MHRILNIAGNENNNIDFVEQPRADFIFITSVKADINIISSLIEENEFNLFKNNIRALEITNLNTFAQIDNYFFKTINYAKVVVLRLFGDKGTWSYGVEQLIKWQEANDNRTLLILSGTEEEDLSLNELSSINLKTSIKITKLLRAGGRENYRRFLYCLTFLSSIEKSIPEKYTTEVFYPDPYQYDWQNEKGLKVGIISYKSLFLANEIELSKELIYQLRLNGLSPKTVFISSLKNLNVQKELINIFKKEEIKLLITTTSFSSSLNTHSKDVDENLNIFKSLNIPILQVLTSNKSRKEWIHSSTGMNSTDLLMQIIIPEFDGRITTKPCAFKEVISINKTLCSKITNYKVDNRNIKWITKLACNYVKLNNLKNFDKKISLVIANYPVKNGRIGNGVGLNTPQSVLNILYWLKEEGYDLGSTELPKNSSQLFSLLIKTRTNDIESQNNEPLDYLSLTEYLEFWNKLSLNSKNLIINRWGLPSKAPDIENKGFSINGLLFGKICLLIQPQRGYDIESNRDIHSPDLPPPHRYLAQYHWLENNFNSNAICHIGKHGTVEWLPGKSIGLSNDCFPSIICPPIPNIYPFIVNDPGEGSQAKRRTHATIIDHLTPPLDRSELYGNLSILEQSLDEYYEAKLLNSKRINIIEKSILEIIKSDFKDIILFEESNKIEAIDSYLCELKESQIRTGLHIFGTRQKFLNEINLILSIARVPTSKRCGLIQYISTNLNLELDPWTNDYQQILSDKDKEIINYYSKDKINNFRRALEFLEFQAKYLIYYSFYRNQIILNDLEILENKKILLLLTENKKNEEYFYIIHKEIVDPIIKSSINEKLSFINSLKGLYVNSGPSGAPTRGKTEVLPTGKNFFSIDSRGLPTESAWIVGCQSASQIVGLYKQEHGQDLKKIAISVWATSTMRNGGEDICQILYLIGVKPIWDGPSRRVIDLEIIPLSVLGRPRVDVTLRISGMFRDAFPQLISLVHKAIQIVSHLNEDIKFNPILDSLKNGDSLNRIFGSAPGAYGAGLQELISNSSWDNNDDLADSYLNWSKWIYSDSNEPIENKKELEKVLKNIQVVIHNQDNREHDILDSDDYYQFQGGISSAIKKLKGKYPEIYHGDLSKFRKSKINKLSYEINKVVRTRVLNPKWIDGMKENGYKGAFEFSATLDYLYAYDATTELVSDWCYNQIYKSWICDEKLKQFFFENNPWALRDLSQRFIEIIYRRMWKESTPEILDNLKKIVNMADSKIEKNEY